MNSFLIKLKSQKKLELVERSEEMYLSYLIKSENCLKSAKVLLSSSLYENSVIDSYYSMYNCLLALFFKCGIKCENHAGSIILLDEVFSLHELSKILKEAKRSRLDSQYYILDAKEEVDQNMTRKSIIISEDFILKLKSFAQRIKQSEIEQIRELLSKMGKK